VRAARRTPRLTALHHDGTGYWHQKQIEGVINQGIQVLIPPDAGKQARMGRRRLRAHTTSA
jgi:hypothetical protein